MKSLADFLTPDELRAINLSIFQDPAQPYLRSGPFGTATTREIEQNIRNVPGRKLRRVIEALPQFDKAGIPAAWSHFMALCAGTHPWPDANHRTGHIAFAEACLKAWQVDLALSPHDAAALTGDSKKLRDPHRRASSGKATYYTVTDLADPNHPYRVLYRQYEAKLQLNPG